MAYNATYTLFDLAPALFKLGTAILTPWWVTVIGIFGAVFGAIVIIIYLILKNKGLIN